MNLSITDWKIAFIVIAIMLLAFGLWVDSEMCAYRFNDNGIESKYTIIGGCMVYDGREWITEREFL